MFHIIWLLKILSSFFLDISSVAPSTSKEICTPRLRRCLFDVLGVLQDVKNQGVERACVSQNTVWWETFRVKVYLVFDERHWRTVTALGVDGLYSTEREN